MSECEICWGDPSLLCPKCGPETHCRYCGEELLTEDEESRGWCDICDKGGE
jgi:primosomal protein N'